MKKQYLFAFGLALTMNAQGASIHSGLLNYWSLDESGADTASSFAESTGVTSNEGTPNGNAAYAAGLFGSALSLDGTAGTYVTVPDGPGSDAGGVANDVDRTGSDLTLSAWVQVSSFTTNWQGIIAHGEQNDYRLARRGNLNVLAYAGGTGDIQGTTDVNDGAWHHVAAVTLNGGTTQLFIDGVLEVTGAGPASIAASNANNGAGNNVLWIGGNPDNGREFNGLLDDIAMWDRGLSAEEISTIYSQGIAGNSLATIPEPSSALLMLSGLFAGMIRRKR